MKIDNKFHEHPCSSSPDGEHRESLVVVVVDGGARQLSVCCIMCDRRAKPGPQQDVSILTEFGFSSLDEVPVVYKTCTGCSGVGCEQCESRTCTAPGCTTPKLRIHEHHNLPKFMGGKEVADSLGCSPYCREHHVFLHQTMAYYIRRQVISAIRECLENVSEFLKLDDDTQADLREYVRKQMGQSL